MNPAWLLHFTLVALPAIAEESKVIPIANLGQTELGAVIPREVYGVVIYILAQCLWALLRHVWKGKNDKENETAKDIKRIFELLHQLQGRVSELKAAPSEEVILMRLRPYVKSEVLENLMKFKGKSSP